MRRKVQRHAVLLKKCAVAPLTEFQQQYVEQIAANHELRFSPDQCYRNAQQLIINDSKKRRLRYWEGLMHGSPYAWVTMGGKVIDVTAEAVGRETRRRVRGSRERSDYWGIVVSRREVLRHILETSDYGPVVNISLLRSASTHPSR